MKGITSIFPRLFIWDDTFRNLKKMSYGVMKTGFNWYGENDFVSCGDVFLKN